MKKQKKYIHHTTIKEIELCDLDLHRDDFVFGLNKDGHEYDGWIKKQRGNQNYWWCGENDYAEIDKVIETLNELKKAGATHVDITPHGDHHGYYFYGSIFRKATEKEIQKKLNVENRAKINAIKTEIENAKKILKSYPQELEKLKNDSE